MSSFDEMKPDQQLAIELLVLGDPKLPGKPMKYQDIAEACGVAEFTLRRWRKDPRFIAARKEFREEMKGDLVDEALKTLRRAMRQKDSTNAAEIALKYAGEMVERRSVEGNMNVNQQIDVRNSDGQKLLEQIKQLQQQLGLPEGSLYIGQGDVVDGEFVDGNDDDDKNTE